MSVLDDFNRFAFERAKSKYNRAQYDQMTHDDWVALVEGYKVELNEARDTIAAREEELNERD